MYVDWVNEQLCPRSTCCKESRLYIHACMHACIRTYVHTHTHIHTTTLHHPGPIVSSSRAAAAAASAPAAAAAAGLVAVIRVVERACGRQEGASSVRIHDKKKCYCTIQKKYVYSTIQKNNMFIAR